MAVMVRRDTLEIPGMRGPVREKCQWCLDKLWPPKP